MDRLLNIRIILGIQGESLSDCTLKLQDFQLNFFLSEIWVFASLWQSGLGLNALTQRPDLINFNKDDYLGNLRKHRGIPKHSGCGRCR